MSNVINFLKIEITTETIAEFLGMVCTSEAALLLLATGSIFAPMVLK